MGHTPRLGQTITQHQFPIVNHTHADIPAEFLIGICDKHKTMFFRQLVFDADPLGRSFVPQFNRDQIITYGYVGSAGRECIAQRASFLMISGPVKIIWVFFVSASAERTRFQFRFRSGSPPYIHPIRCFLRCLRCFAMICRCVGGSFKITLHNPSTVPPTRILSRDAFFLFFAMPFTALFYQGVTGVTGLSQVK